MGVNPHIALDLIHKPTNTDDSGFIKAASTPNGCFLKSLPISDITKDESEF